MNNSDLFDGLDKVPELIKTNEKLIKTICNLMTQLAREDKDSHQIIKKMITDTVESSNKDIQRIIINAVDSAFRDYRTGIGNNKTETDDKNVGGAKRTFRRFGCFGVVLLYTMFALLFVARVIKIDGAEKVGREYGEILQSKYITEEESLLLRSDLTPIVVLPKEFEIDPDRVKAIIKRNKETIRQRQEEAKRNGGRWSSDVGIER